jgi:hypothetical protein
MTLIVLFSGEIIIPEYLKQFSFIAKVVEKIVKNKIISRNFFILKKAIE